MGKLETASKKRSKRVRIENIVLGTLAIAGVATITLAAPNMLRLLKDVDPEWAQKRDPRRRLRETFSRMKKRGLIEFETEDGKRRARLTALGEREARRIGVGTYKIRVPLRWDGKWRVIIFDISHRTLRDEVRRLVTSFGFHRLQDSVWVFPYDCEEIIALLKLDLKIGKELLYMIVDAIEADHELRVHFKLPRD